MSYNRDNIKYPLIPQPIEIIIDNVDNSSFLNNKHLQILQNYINKINDSQTGKKNQYGQYKKRDILKNVQKILTFDKVFSTRGVQGITGLLNVSNSPDKIVFKISIDLDRTIEHENLVSKDLNRLRAYCPHFVGNIGMINLPISNDFINDPDKESLFKNSNDYFPCNVLLLEYISPISIYHVCKYLYKNKSLIISQMVQIMMALEFAQLKCKFTSYDLHLDNILIRQIEEDSLFLYIHKGRNVLIQTFGIYPVIIDLGSSYVKATEGHPMYTSADNYNNGLQPTLFDNLNDVHHLLISMLYYLDDKSYAYNFLRTRFMFLFRHIPILSQQGWKQLPRDILELVCNKIKKDCPKTKMYSVYSEYDEHIINILNGLIILPWTEHGELDFNDCMESFLIELQKIQDIDNISSTDDILYILRETVDVINLYRDIYHKNKNQAITKFTKEWKSRISFIISNNLKAIPKNLNFEILFTSALNVADRLSANYYKYVEEHVAFISETYLQTKITCPWDAAKVLLQNATPTVNINNTCKIYIWDSAKENKTVIVPTSLTPKQIDDIDNCSIFKKGDKLLQCLKANGQL
jgi:hypothetical protein